MISFARPILIVILLSSSLTLVGSARGQTYWNKKPQPNQKQKDESKAKLSEADLLYAQRRTFAISLVILRHLRYEHRSLQNLVLDTQGSYCLLSGRRYSLLVQAPL